MMAAMKEEEREFSHVLESSEWNFVVGKVASWAEDWRQVGSHFWASSVPNFLQIIT